MSHQDAAPRVLVVAATARELATGGDWATCLCGVGPVEAAAATAAAITAARPAAILHVGIAGARRKKRLPPAALVIGAESRYVDLAAQNPFAPRVLWPAAALVDAARRALPEAPALAIGTSARVGGTAGDACDVEAMEGFAVLRAAALADIPAIEIRAISNDIEEADRAKWHMDAAFAAITRATPGLVEEIRRCVR
jgi:nucleoside phosphorylase